MIFSFYDCSLHTLTVISAIISVIGIVLSTAYIILSNRKRNKLTIRGISRNKTRNITISESKLPNAHVSIVSAKTKNEDIKLLKITAAGLFIIALILIFIVAHFHNTAKKYGAYGDFDKTESISSILTTVSYSYIDQSDNLPEDITGTIIIYYRYNCDHCRLIHDELIDIIKNKDNIYTVSTRSEKGMTLVREHSISEVPSAVYIFKEPHADMFYADVMLYEPSNKNTDKSVFIMDNLEQLLMLQKEGI